MSSEKIVLRSYKKCFEASKVKTISRLLDDLEEIARSPAEYSLYTSEIQRCLSVGLLLAALSVSISLLELFVRDLRVAYKILSDHGGNMALKASIEREMERDRQKSFDAMVGVLEPVVVTPADAKALRDFYAQTRIPVAHALVRRLTSQVRPWADMFDDIDPSRSSRDLEERLEDAAIGEVKFVVQMVKKYLPWLLKRYSVQ